jgi:hypothetical protein
VWIAVTGARLISAIGHDQSPGSALRIVSNGWSRFRELREQLDALDKANQQLAQKRDDETKALTRVGLLTLKRQ